MDETIGHQHDSMHLNEKEDLLKKLDDLFVSAPPQQLRQSIHEIYLTYIIQNHEMLPVNFTRIATDIYFLLDFLEKIEQKKGSVI
jgi:hypothetical protein